VWLSLLYIGFWKIIEFFPFFIFPSRTPKDYKNVLCLLTGSESSSSLVGDFFQPAPIKFYLHPCWPRPDKFRKQFSAQQVWLVRRFGGGSTRNWAIIHSNGLPISPTSPQQRGIGIGCGTIRYDAIRIRYNAIHLGANLADRTANGKLQLRLQL